MKKKEVFGITLKKGSGFFIVFIFLVTFISNSQFLSISTSVKDYFEDLSATITVDNNKVCQNGAKPKITFKAEGGESPYTFTYKIDGGAEITISTSDKNDSVDIEVNTNISGDFKYELIRVEDNKGEQLLTGKTVTITVIPNFTVSAGNDILVCKGNTISLSAIVSRNGTNTVTYSWSGPNNFRSNQQSPNIPNSTIEMSGNYTVTASIGSCLVQDIVKVDVAEPKITDVNENIILNFSKCNTSPATILFKLSIPSYESSIKNYLIDWGDNTSGEFTSSSNIISHIYTTGSYTMSIQMVLTNGCTTTKRYPVFIGSSPSPATLQLLPNQSNGCSPHATQWYLNIPKLNVVGTTYICDWGDNSGFTYFQGDSTPLDWLMSDDSPTSITYLISKVYSEPSCGKEVSLGGVTYYNVYQPTVVTQNPCSTTPQPSGTGIVSVGKGPTASFTPSPLPDKICIGQVLQLNNTSDFGLTIPSSNGANCINTSPFYWTISPSIPGAWTASGLGSNNGDLNDYTNWTIGSMTPSITFNLAGTYTITLRVKNSCGDSSSVPVTICVEPQLDPKFTINQNKGCTPLAVKTTNLTDVSEMCSLPTYLWEVAYTADNCGTIGDWTFTNSTDKNSEAPAFFFKEAGIYTLKLTTTNSCGSFSITQDIEVKKPPTVAITPIPTLCQTLPTTIINPIATIENCTSDTSGLTYEWSFPNGTPATSTTANPGSISYDTSGTFPFSLKVTNECGSTIQNSSFTIKPTPTVDAITSQQKCTGQTSDTIVFDGSEAGTEYHWTNTNTSIGLAATGSGNINPFTLINTGTTVLTATITVTPSLDGCLGTSKTFDITVIPEATVNAISSLVLCNAAIQNEISFTSAEIGTTFSWTNNTPSIGLAAGGTGNIPAFTAINLSTSPIVATIIVTPSNTLGCNGISKTFTITVNPTPSPLVLTNQEYCNGVATTALTFSNAVTGTTYTWTNSNPAIGLSANGVGNIPIFIPINTSSSPMLATISITPISNGCMGTTQTFTITVNPSPVVNFSIPNQTICSGDTSALVTLNSTSSGVTFNWTAVQPAGITGVSLNGTNTIPVQTLVNTTNANIVVTYNATATLASGATCAGAVFPYTITVKPKPFIATNSTAEICSGLLFSKSPTNGAGNSIPAGTTYTWDVPVVTGGITGGISGSNQTTIFGTLTNSTNVVQTATYTVTPSTNGCSGLPFDVVVSVNPIPDVNATPNLVLCAGESSTQIDLTGNVAGASYTWSSNNTSIGITASGLNTIPSFTAINTGNTPVIATVTVEPTATSCSGISKTFTITVNPTPTINATANLVKCNGSASGIIPFAGNVAGTTFDWTNDNPTIGLATTGSGNIPSFSTTNTGIIPITANITVTPKTNGCFGTPNTFTITVNPTPTVDVPLNETICNGQSTTTILFSGAIPNTTYNWTNSNSTIGLGASGVGDIPSFTAVNNGTNPIVANFTVTPSLNGCTGVPKTFTITINPSPAVVFTPVNQIICSGSSSGLVHLTSTAAGATFAWTAVEPSGITGVLTSGTNTIPAQTLTNSTNLPITITYLATAKSNSSVSCEGIPYPYTITVQPVPKITTTQNQRICSNTTFSIIPLDGSGNSVPLGTTYSWGVPVVTGGITGGAAMADQTTVFGTLINPTNNIQTATYTVIPTSGTCTGAPFTVVITVNPSPKVQFSEANQTLCSGAVSNPIVLTSSTTGNVTFNWNATIPTGITGATASGTTSIPIQTLENTTTNPLTVVYSATATIENNGILCTGKVFDYEITVNPTIVTTSILSNYNGFNVSAVGASDGAINVNVTGGLGSYTYLWTGPNGFSAASQDISNVPSGMYSLTINDGLCSPVVLNFTLTAPMPLLIEEDVASHLDVLCFGYLTGVIKVAITQESVGPYDYLLALQGGGGVIISIEDSAATNHTFTGLAAGVYDISITDANGSEKTISGIVITEPSGITAAITAKTDVSCAGSSTGSATVTASGGIGTLTYSWNTTPIQTTATAIGLTAGTYNVTITDANNCSIEKQAIITEPNSIVTSIDSQTNVLCFGANTGAVTVSASGGTGILSYLWDTVPTQTTTTVTDLIAGTYNVTVTDANGCSKVQTVIITQPLAELSSIISNSTNVSCFGGDDGNATATVTGGTAPYAYSWNTIPVQTTPTATGLKAGNYSVLISDINGCSTTTTITIAEPVAMTASITDQTNVLCSGNNTGSATVTVNGGTLPYSYSWNTTPIQTSNEAVNLPMGIYTVTISDARGCTTTSQATITEPNGIISSIASQTNVDCFGNNTGAVTVLASGGAGTLTYSWDTVPVQTNPSLTGLVAGTYNLTITDANNCTKVQTVTISEPNELVIISDQVKNINCYGYLDGEILITTNGGTAPFNYNWTTNDGSGIVQGVEDQTALGAGTYHIAITDTNGCIISETFTLTEPSPLATNVISSTNILCFGESTGAIEIAVFGGTPFEISPGIYEYQYNWAGPNGFTSNSQNISNLIAGTYLVTVTDALGCTQETSVTLTQPTEIIIDVTKTDVTCYGANDGRIQIAIQGGNAPYAISWSNLGNGFTQNNLSAGIYMVKVEDQNGCQKVETIEITQPIFYIDPLVTQISCFGENDGSIELNIVGGISPLTIKWDDDNSAGVERNNLSAGTYTVLLTDSDVYQCPITAIFTIIEPLEISLNGIVEDATDCTIVNSGSIDLQVVGGTLPYSYSWSHGATTEDLSNIPPGSYLVTVTDAHACSETKQFNVTRQDPLAISLTENVIAACELKEISQETIAMGAGGFPPYTFNWSGGVTSGLNNEIMTTDQSGTYSVAIIDSQGCSYKENFTVNVPYIGNQSFDYTSFGIENYQTLSIDDPIQFTNKSTGDYVSIRWDFGDGSLIVYEENPEHTYTYEDEFVVTQTVEYEVGCSFSYSRTLPITKGYELINPTGFTPNNDGINDVMRPKYKGLIAIEMSIYDTWGSLIYSEEGLTLKGWDGLLKGTEAENGNYIMVVKGTSFYGKEIKETTPITLLK